MTSHTHVPSTQATAADHRWSPRLWGLLTVVCLVLFLDGLDVSMVGVALPSIGADLGLSTSALQWIVSGYVLGYGGLLLLGGRMADLLGRRRVFLVAVAVFALASLLGGMVDNGALLIATRFIKGVSAAFTAPTGLSIITTTFAEGRARNKALSIYTVFGATGFSSGLVIGGLFTGLGWRWTYLSPVPIAVGAFIAGLLLIPRDRPAASGGHDLLGSITLPAGMLLLVYTVVRAPEAGWTDPSTIGLFGLAIAILAAFVVIEQRVAHPLVRLSILRRGSIVRANVGFIAMFGAYLSFQFIVTLYLQDVLGWTPLSMALALLPAGVLVAFSAPYAERLINKFGTPRLIATSMAVFVVGYFLFIDIDTNPVYATAILPTVLLLGAGFAIGFPSINVQATSGVDDSEQGLASGLVWTSGQVGGALVLAVTTALVTAGTPAEPSASAMLAQFRPGIVLVMFVALGGLLLTVLPLARRRTVPAEREPLELEPTG
ncbi:MAG TPA: MFS transporter [Jiangellaceae bacterium]|nr:MFS transporter [Jiangellaceae bacterium]